MHFTNCVFVGFSRIFLLGTFIFKGLTAQRLYKSFGVKGLKQSMYAIDISNAVYAPSAVLY
jgi:hypothetical protein